MVFLILCFVITLTLFYIIINSIKNWDKLQRLNTIIEYIWLIGAFSGILFGFYELNRIEKSREIQNEYYTNWANYNSERMKLISIIPAFNSKKDSNKINEESRWLNLLCTELERGYDNKLWKTIIYGNYDKIIPKTENSSVHLEHPTFKGSRFHLDTTKVSKYFLKEVKPIILGLDKVRLSWKRQFDIQKEISKKSNYELFLKKYFPYFLCIILAMRIAKISIITKARQIKDS